MPSYRKSHLDALLKERRILEYGSHAAAYLPMQDYRYCLPYMQTIASGVQHWRKPDPRAMARVLARIRDEGPLMARDFDHDGARDEHWGWNWKPAKIALKPLFIEGKLMASHRVGFQKFYDLPEPVIPAGIDTAMPTDEEFHRYLILSTLKGHGLAAEVEFSYLRKGHKAGVRNTLKDMLDMGEVIAITVDQLPGTWYTTQANLEALAGTRISKHVHLLSPFDNAVIKRKRIQALFDRQYQIECFVRSAKRQFGYCCQPILHGTDNVGRLDPKADRKNSTFILRSLHLEKPLTDLNAFINGLAKKLT